MGDFESPMIRRRKSPSVVRRSVAIPRSLIDDALRVSADGENVNRVVKTALQEYVDRRHRNKFAADMAEMARDPQIRREMKRIEGEFRAAEGDGL